MQPLDTQPQEEDEEEFDEQTFQHDLFQLETYSDQAYCIGSNVLNGKQCKKCCIKFTSDGEDNSYRVRTKTPVYCCVNSQRGCKEMFCAPCHGAVVKEKAQTSERSLRTKKGPSEKS